MNRIQTPIQWALLALTSAVLISCGGGGSSSSAGTSSVSGTAATGAPIINAAVTVFDTNGNSVCTTTTDSSGWYSCAGINSATNFAPYIVKVVGGVGDSVDTLYAVAPSAGTANVSHISNAIAAAVAKGDPSTLEAGTKATATDVNNADNAHQAALSNLYAAFNYAGSVVTGAFNSTLDGLLDNTHARVLGDGTVELGSSQGFIEDGLMGILEW